MEFFDKKEEVIDVQLTQYGKQLLSKGEFKPVSYAFFDDNVLYDSQYADVASEPQNSIEPRIQEDTPALKTQYMFYGAETELKRLAAEMRGSGGQMPSVQPRADKHYATSAPLGTSALNTNLLPAYQARFFAAPLKGTVNYLTGALPTTRIPQLDSVVEYKTELYDANSTPPSDGLGYEAQLDSSVISTQPEYKMASNTFEDGTYFVTTGDQLLLEITEKNTDFFKENFDIEVFIVEEVDVSGSISTPNTAKTDKKEILKQLNFAKRYPAVVDNLLADLSMPPSTELDPDDVDYYFNVKVDNEIAPETLCAIIQQLKSEGQDVGYLSTLDISCPDISPTPFDIYGTRVTDEDIEKCLD